jgi:hypothetical protein
MRSKKLTKTPRASRNAMRHRLHGTARALESVRGKKAPKNSEKPTAQRRYSVILGLYLFVKRVRTPWKFDTARQKELSHSQAMLMERDAKIFLCANYLGSGRNRARNAAGRLGLTGSKSEYDISSWEPDFARRERLQARHLA